MEKVIYRSAVAEDLPILLRFEQGIIAAERPYDSTLKPDPISYYDLAQKITSTDAEVVVAVIHDEIIGSGFAEIRTNKAYYRQASFAYLGFMYVAPTYRGRGVISGILNHLKTWAQSRGILEIKLEVYHDNVAAMKAYEKAGFKKNLTEMRLSLDA